MDDLPIFEEAPLRAVDFAPRALRPGGGRVPLAVGAWAFVLASLAGVGMLAGDPPAVPAPAIAVPATDGPSRPVSNLPSTRMGALLLQDVIDLVSPAPARVEVTTPQVGVEGAVLVRAARVEIFLEARGNRVLEHVSVDVTDPDGGIRPTLAARFSAAFDLPNPRPNATMWVVVTAYDEHGMPLGGTRRPFAVGPLLEPQLALADSQPMSERWRPQPTPRMPALHAPPPTCIPVSPTLASSC